MDKTERMVEEILQNSDVGITASTDGELTEYLGYTEDSLKSKLTALVEAVRAEGFKIGLKSVLATVGELYDRKAAEDLFSEVWGRGGDLPETDFPALRKLVETK